MMALEVTEPAIRLFGRMIQVQRAPNDDVLALCYSAASVSSSSSSSSDNKTPGDLRELKKGNYLSTLPPNPDNPDNCEEEGLNLNKRLKKQSKVLLACPRCKSAATKFCYFNNYNTKQPRHFCRGCQRYWTAGGSMRSMAVGAGRRKLKKSASLSSWPEAKTISAPVCGFFQVPVYAETAVAPYWAWVSPVKELSSSVWAPKTVRFDDAGDVAKSTFWSTLGI